MAHGQDTRDRLRRLYVLERISLEIAALQCGISQSTASRWKREALDKGDDWDKLRAAHLLAGDGIEAVARAALAGFMTQYQATMDALNANPDIPPEKKVQILASLADSFNKTVAASKRVLPEAARLEKATQARPTLKTNTAGQITNHAEIKAWEQAQATAARESRLAKTGKLIGKAGGVVLGGVLAANEALDINKDPTLSDQQKKIAWSGLAGDVAGGTIGGWGGAAMGAALGTAILPGIGTAIGGLLGAIGGAISGGWLGNKAGIAAGTAWFSDPSGSSGLAGNGGNSLQPQPPLALLQSVMDSSTRFNLAADKLQQASQQPMVVQLQGEFRLNGNDLVAVVNQNNSLTARRN